MIIPIDEKTRIRSDAVSWMIEVPQGGKRKGEWSPIKYYVSLGMALEAAAQRELRMDPAEGIQEALAALKRITDKYEKLFDIKQESSQ